VSYREVGEAGTAEAVAVGEGERWFGRVLWDTREGGNKTASL
jgi:hypothetical protein